MRSRPAQSSMWARAIPVRESADLRHPSGEYEKGRDQSHEEVIDSLAGPPLYWRDAACSFCSRYAVRPIPSCGVEALGAPFTYAKLAFADLRHIMILHLSIGTEGQILGRHRQVGTRGYSSLVRASLGNLREMHSNTSESRPSPGEHIRQVLSDRCGPRNCRYC